MTRTPPTVRRVCDCTVCRRGITSPPSHALGPPATIASARQDPPPRALLFILDDVLVEDHPLPGPAPDTDTVSPNTLPTATSSRTEPRLPAPLPQASGRATVRGPLLVDTTPTPHLDRLAKQGCTGLLAVRDIPDTPNIIAPANEIENENEGRTLPTRPPTPTTRPTPLVTQLLRLPPCTSSPPLVSLSAFHHLRSALATTHPVLATNAAAAGLARASHVLRSSPSRTAARIYTTLGLATGPRFAVVGDLEGDDAWLDGDGDGDGDGGDDEDASVRAFSPSPSPPPSSFATLHGPDLARATATATTTTNTTDPSQFPSLSLPSSSSPTLLAVHLDGTHGWLVNPRDRLRWLDEVVGQLFAWPGTEEEVILIVVLGGRFGTVGLPATGTDSAITHPPYSDVYRSHHRAKAFRPRQSFEEVADGVPSAPWRAEHTAWVGTHLPGVIRRDAVERVDVGATARVGGGGCILAEHVVGEVAYKMGCTYKYGQ